MKRRIILSVVFVLSIVLLSLVTSDSKANAHVWVTVGFFEVSAPVQTVEVNTPRDSYDAVFHNEVQVRNGSANGFLTLPVPDGAARHQNGANFIFVDGSVRFSRDGAVAAVRLRGRTVEGNQRITVIITPAATEDCLIYTTVGTDVTATFEVEGILTLIAD